MVSLKIKRAISKDWVRKVPKRVHSEKCMWHSEEIRRTGVQPVTQISVLYLYTGWFNPTTVVRKRQGHSLNFIPFLGN